MTERRRPRRARPDVASVPLAGEDSVLRIPDALSHNPELFLDANGFRSPTLIPAGGADQASMPMLAPLLAKGWQQKVLWSSTNEESSLASTVANAGLALRLSETPIVSTTSEVIKLKSLN